MSIDVRHHDWQRSRRWGRQPVMLGRLDPSGDVIPVEKVVRFFSVFDRRDELTGRITFEFRFYQLKLDRATVNDIDAICYDGAIYEVEAKELKERDPVHWLFSSVRYSGGNQG